MQFLIKKTAKILSFSENKTASFQTIVAKLGPLVNKIGQENLLASIRFSQLFTASTTNANDLSCWVVKLHDEISQELNDEHLLPLFWKEESSNLAISTVYRFIYQAGSEGVSYLDLASKINSFITISGNKVLKPFNASNTSHYCRKLLNMKFIVIKKVYTSRVAIATKFTDKDGDQIDVQAKRKMHNFDLKSQEDTHDKIDSQIFKRARISDAWNYLKEDTCILRELTLNQNTLLNIASYESYLKEGLLQTEIAWKLNKTGEIKMFVRELDSILEMFNVLQAADRKGRTFFLKYQIRTQQMANFIDGLLGDKKIDLKAEADELMRQQLIKKEELAENQNTQQIMIQQPFDQMDCEDQEELVHFGKVPKDKLLLLSNPVSAAIQATTPVTVDTLFSSSPKLNSQSFHHIYNYFKEHKNFLQDSLNAADQQFIEKCFIRLPSQRSRDYRTLSEMLLLVIHCSIEFNLSFLTQQASQRSDVILDSNIFQEPQTAAATALKSTKSLKRYKTQISKCKLCRLIFILNMVNEKKVLNSFDLKNAIIKNEYSKGKIDKKTLQRIMNAFQYIGYIQIIKKVLPYQVKQQNIIRYIFVHKDVALNDPRVIKAEKTITNGILSCCQKVKGSNSAGNNENENSKQLFSAKGEVLHNSQSNKETYELHSHTGVTNCLKSPTRRKDNKSKLSVSQCSSQLLYSQKTQSSQETEKSFLLTNQKKDKKMSVSKINYCFDEEEEEDKQCSQFTGEMSLIQKKTKIEFVIKEEGEEEEKGIEILGSNYQQKISRQNLEGLTKVTQPKGEVSAKPLNLSILVAIIFQACNKRIQSVKKQAFMKILVKQGQSQFYQQLCSDKFSTSNNPLFQENLCQSFQSLRSSESRQIQQRDLSQDLKIKHESEQSLSELEISEEYAENPNSEDSSSNNNDDINTPLGKKTSKTLQCKSSQEKIIKVSHNQQDQSQLIHQKNNESSRKILSFTEEENILKLKNFFLKYPSNTFSHLMSHFPVEDFFSFLSSCTSSGQMKLFILDPTLPTVKHTIELTDIQSENLDQVFYQITPEFQVDFNIS